MKEATSSPNASRPGENNTTTATVKSHIISSQMNRTKTSKSRVELQPRGLTDTAAPKPMSYQGGESHISNEVLAGDVVSSLSVDGARSLLPNNHHLRQLDSYAGTLAYEHPQTQYFFYPHPLFTNVDLLAHVAESEPYGMISTSHISSPSNQTSLLIQ